MQLDDYVNVSRGLAGRRKAERYNLISGGLAPPPRPLPLSTPGSGEPLLLLESYFFVLFCFALLKNGFTRTKMRTKVAQREMMA